MMARFYDYFLIFYSFVAIIVAVLFLRSSYVLPEKYYYYIFITSIPFFLFLTGIAIGYVLGYLWILKNDIDDIDFINKVYIKASIVGSIIGVFLSALYIYFSN